MRQIRWMGIASLFLLWSVGAGRAKAQTTPQVILSPTQISFPDTQVGMQAAALHFTITNNGPGTLTITNVSVSAGFSENSNGNCPHMLAQGSSCMFGVKFEPTLSGPQTGTVTFTDNGQNGHQSVALSGTAIDALGTATVQSTDCSQLGIKNPSALTNSGGRTCDKLTVACPNVSESIEVDLVVDAPASGVTGTVILGTGEGGNGYYQVNFGANGTSVLNNLLTSGYTTVQLAFNCPIGSTCSPFTGCTAQPTAVGWTTASTGEGLRKLSCRYATVANWVSANIHTSNTPLCATGNSNGGALIAYGLAHYGLDQIFTFVEPTSAPPLTLLDDACGLTGHQMTQTISCQANCGTTLMQSDVLAHMSQLCIIDTAYIGLQPNPFPCSTHDNSQATFLAMDSVDSSDALTKFNTNVRLLVGCQDKLVPAQAFDWYNAISVTSGHTQSEACVNSPHAIPGSGPGAAQISMDIPMYCK